MNTTTEDNEYSTFEAFSVLCEGKCVTVVDTFLHAVEAAETLALEKAKEVDEKTASVAILVDQTEAKGEGFFGRWKVYDEKEGKANLELFRRYQSEGYWAHGAWRQKPIISGDSSIVVHRTVIELFEGYYVPFDTARFARSTTMAAQIGNESKGVTKEEKEEEEEDDDCSYECSSSDL